MLLLKNFYIKKSRTPFISGDLQKCKYWEEPSKNWYEG